MHGQLIVQVNFRNGLTFLPIMDSMLLHHFSMPKPYEMAQTSQKQKTNKTIPLQA